MIHIYFNTWDYQEQYIREYTSEGEPVYDGYDIYVEQAYCGDEDYQGRLDFTKVPEKATCEECVEAFAMQTLGDLP